MATPPKIGPLDFLQGDPAPVKPGPQTAQDAAEDPADRLSAATVSKLMKLAGVDGVWIERLASGERVVVLHHTPKGSTSHLPRQVKGMATKIVGGEPIRAGV